jgi:clan AA aspartic protease
MIVGRVNADIEAVIQLVIVGPDQQHQTLDGVIDTGFSGDLTLPTTVISSLGLTWLGREAGILADGSIDLFDVYAAMVLWDGRPRSVEIEAADTQPLFGMNQLHRHSLRIEIQNGGRVEISSLS